MLYSKLVRADKLPTLTNNDTLFLLLRQLKRMECLTQKKSTDPDDLTSKPILLSASPGARTLDTLIKSQVLYQLS